MALRASSMMISLLLLLTSTSSTSYNIIDFGAKPDGHTDAAPPFLAAWAAACLSDEHATVFVPDGVFYLSKALFQGPCKNAGLSVQIRGAIVAPTGYTASTEWVTFKDVVGLSIYGGTLDGRGQALWSCKLAGRSCPTGAASLTITDSKDVLISGLTSVNSELFHISIYSSSGVTVQAAKITAPADSPNTDGIHVQLSTGVTVAGAAISTGDDCISMGPGSTNVLIERVSCGPGHGISIGSLGGAAGEPGVRNVTVRSTVLTETQNGLRIKTWAKPYRGLVKGVVFEGAVMRDVENPIIVDQNYCPDDVNCPKESSGIEISDVWYRDVEGTSATEVAMNFNCSPTNPCSGIGLQDVKLTYRNAVAKSVCHNAHGAESGFVIPPSCL